MGAVWAKKHGVPLTCNEFGVYRKAPAADRNRCIEDTRKALGLTPAEKTSQ